MKSLWKMIAGALGLAAVAGLLFLGNAFLGNPVSHALAARAAEAYMDVQYPGSDLYVKRLGYSFKNGDYYAIIQSESSEDTNFYLSIDMLGDVTNDNYDAYVTDGLNTANRLNAAYRELTDTVIKNERLPYTLDFGAGHLAILRDTSEAEYGFGILQSELELDKEYDIKAMGAEYGYLSLYMMDETVTVEKAAEMVLAIRSLCDEAGVPFRVIDLTLRHIPDEDGRRAEGSVYAVVHYDDIVEEGLTERVQASHDEKTAYFAELDAKNKGI